MRNNFKKNNNPKTAARTPAARQGAAANTSLAERREKAVIRLPEERRKGTKYQVIRGQNLKANKKETYDSTNAASIKKAAAKQEEKREKAKRQTMAKKAVKDEKEKGKPSSASNDTNAVNEAKKEYVKSEKAAEYTERLQTNIDLSKAVSIPPAVTWEQVLDHSVQKDTVYLQDGTASERAVSYKEKANFYLDKMKKNTETGQKEINPNRDKAVGDLYKKAYKLAYKEEQIEKKNSTLFNKAQSVIQLKKEVDNTLNNDNTGEAVVTAAAIPITHIATKAVRNLADKNKIVNVGKTGFELAANVTSAAAAADGVGEATVDVVAVVPKYFVEKKLEKTVRQVMQNQHDRKINAQKERLKQQQEKVEKRAQTMKKESMQHKMKADLYKSEHSMGTNGNALQRIKTTLKVAVDNTKRAIQSLKSSKLLLLAGGSILPIFFVIIIIIILTLFVFFPFFYLIDIKGNIMDSNFLDTIHHYYAVMDGAVDKYNNKVIFALINSADEYDNTGVENPEKKAKYDEDYANYQAQVELLELSYYDEEAGELYLDTYGYDFFPEEPEKDYWYTYEELSNSGMERGPIFEGFVWDEKTDAQEVPKGKLYDEMLCTISTNNTKAMNASRNIIFINDEAVASAYAGAEFWDFESWEEDVECPSGGNCCVKMVEKTFTDKNGNTYTEIVEEPYCPSHYVIMMKLKLDFDLDKVWDSYGFDKEDKKNYKEVKKEYDKEKAKA